MKKILLVFVFITIFSFLSFSQISEKEIYTVADNFIKSEKLFEGYNINLRTDIQELHYKNSLLAYVV